MREELGDAFQVLFSHIMQKTYPGDFSATRPWGNLGDRKCDGWLASAKRNFACYAPQEAGLEATKQKLLSDFEGALPCKGDFWKEWFFVHNSYNGRLATDLLIEVEQLRKKYPDINFAVWGPPEISKLALSLPPHELAALLGPAPTSRELTDLGLKEIDDLLKHIEQSEPGEDGLLPTPKGKIEFNHFPSDIEGLLKLGFSKANVVKKYFATHPDPEYGDRVAARFRAEYTKMQGQGDSSDLIYEQLLRLITGPAMPPYKSLVSAYVVLAFLFEQCEIFERPTATLPQ
jgi:hypothetical protein